MSMDVALDAKHTENLFNAKKKSKGIYRFDYILVNTFFPLCSLYSINSIFWQFELKRPHSTFLFTSYFVWTIIVFQLVTKKIKLIFASQSVFRIRCVTLIELVEVEVLY